MTGPDSDPDALLRTFVEQSTEPMAPTAAREMRAHVVAAMEETRGRLRYERAKAGARSRARRAVYIAAAALLPMIFALGMWRWHAAGREATAAAEVVTEAGRATIAHDGVERPLGLAAQALMDEGDELHTGAASQVRATLPTGATVEVGPDARLRFQRTGQRRRGPMRDRIELVSGKVDVAVPKLRDGDELSVHAEGVTVVVHGTKFSVERLPERLGSPTRVTVLEGRVAVFVDGGEHMLGAGDVWPPAESSLEAARNAEPVETPAAGGSTLAAENAALAEAMRLRRSGHRKLALAALDDFLARYPSSPLTETARVERLRALREMGAGAEARRAAERYLHDYPNGMARLEAQAIATAKARVP